MTDLALGDFATFMRETTSFEPFPWQIELLEAVMSGEAEPQWPDLLDLPTGTGKTTTLHIAVFALALRPDIMPRRICLVVDRRVIVDQVYGVAKELADALESAKDGVTLRVANRLRACAADGTSPPLRASLLRGGIPRDDAWIKTPEQPTVFASTVDQVGSRLLFRGYGVSPGMRPVHAGIVGTDMLYLLDEVHLATAFEKTLSSIASYSGPRWRERDEQVGRPVRVVRMSATPRPAQAEQRRFELGEADRSHEVLAKRLDASRPGRLQLVKTKSGKDAREANIRTVSAAAAKAAQQLADDGARVIGLVMNRVAHAASTAQKLEQSSAGRVLLLTGRMRPFDRARVQAEIDTLARSGRDGQADSQPTFVVATSCIEAGADYDFDGLVTEVASLPALRQRFGRLNRLGTHDSASAVVLGNKHQLSKSALPDPIYGEALANTWRFLEEHVTDGCVDFGLTRFPQVPDEVMETLRTQDATPPTMFPSYLDQWSETRPAPHPDPDVALWLHGKDQEGSREVSLVFRCDVEAPTSTEVDPSTSESLEFIPPLPEEAVSVHIDQARAFIRDRSTAEAGRVVRWDAEGASSVSVREVRVGDALIVPTAWGGLSKGSWDPSATAEVSDVAERVYLARSDAGHGDGVLHLRVRESVLPEAETPPQPPSGSLAEDSDAWDEANDVLLQWLRRPTEEETSTWFSSFRARAMSNEYAAPEWSSDSRGQSWLVTWRRTKRAARATTEDAISSFSGLEVTLDEHLEDVRAWARGFASRAGVSTDVAEDIGLAAWLHDVGKADPRFQVMLRGGDHVAAHSGEALAKSKLRTTARSRAAMQARAGWPMGFRHELLSLALFESSSSLLGRAHDPDLVRHLIASHHGWCRPWAPAVDDPTPVSFRFQLEHEWMEIDTASVNDELRFDCVSRFHRLSRRYGWHGLAYLEALLRLGDHQASRRPKTRPAELDR